MMKDIVYRILINELSLEGIVVLVVFVFVNRVSVQNELKDGTYELCHACRYPLSSIQLKSKKYIKGVSCSNCYGKISDSKKKSLIDRNKQISIAKRRGLYSPYIKGTVNDF